MKSKLPILVKVSVPQNGFNPDAVDAEIYCVNITAETFSISTSSESFTTLDEESGEGVNHGSQPLSFLLLPDEIKLVADVKGWEWDGHVGIKMSFQESGSSTVVTNDYNLKESKEDFLIESLNLKGRVIAPI
jgi:hypothetical protein